MARLELVYHPRYLAALGYEPIQVEEDHLSGRLGPNRCEGLARALAAVRDKEADGLVVFKLDRNAAPQAENPAGSI